MESQLRAFIPWILSHKFRDYRNHGAFTKIINFPLPEYMLFNSEML